MEEAPNQSAPGLDNSSLNQEKKVKISGSPTGSYLEIWYADDSYIDDSSSHEATSQVMPLKDVLPHIVTTKKSILEFFNPQTLADFNHIKCVVDTVKDSVVQISGEDHGSEATVPLYDIFVQKCIEKEKNSVYIKYFDEEFICMDSKQNDFRIQLGYNKISLFPRIVYCLKAMKNRNLLIEVTTGEISRLAGEMNWNFDEEFATWTDNERKMETEYLIVDYQDNNKYKMVQAEMSPLGLLEFASWNTHLFEIRVELEQ